MKWFVQRVKTSNEKINMIIHYIRYSWMAYKWKILCLQSIILPPQAPRWFFVARGIFTSNYSYNLPCSGNNHEKSYNSHNSLRQYDFQFTDFQQLLQLVFNGIRNSQRSFQQYQFFFSNYRRKQYILKYFTMLFYTRFFFKKKATILSLTFSYSCFTFKNY